MFKKPRRRRLQRPPGLPPGCRLQDLTRHDYGAAGSFRLPHTTLQAFWDQGGYVTTTFERDALDRNHGKVQEFDAFVRGPRVEYESTWVHGQLHGIARQYDDQGRTLSRSRFVHGTGIDVWCDNEGVQEYREFVASVPHGLERWGHPARPHEESHFIRGLRCGVTRSWRDGALEPGFPHYFLDGDQVPRATYVRARRSRPELHPDVRAEDAPERDLPDGLRGVWVRKKLRASLDHPPST